MGLINYRIGDLITPIDERNTFGISDFYGLNINKEFMPTVANTEGLDESKYKVVRKNRYVFSGMQTGRDECIRISMYTKESPIIVSPAYMTFEVTATDIVLPMYFFMCFLSREKDRLGWFYSDSSIRSNLDWVAFCDIELLLPSIKTQQKYVDVYEAMLQNQQNYERGLEDLGLACEAMMDKIKREVTHISLGELFNVIDKRNIDGKYISPQGINITKNFMPTVASVEDGSLANYKIVEPGQFAYSPMQTGRDKCIRIAMHYGGNPIIVSPAYSVLQAKKEIVIPEYLMLWLTREETDRRGWFASDASIRANLDLERFFEFTIPLPERPEQQAVANLFKAYMKRKEIAERIKAQLKDICPILIKGSLEEGES